MSLAVGSLFDNEFIYRPGRFFMAVALVCPGKSN